jgi:sugar (pentulose or hexulose) kinase
VRVVADADPYGVWRSAVDHVVSIGASVADAVHEAAGTNPRPLLGCGGWLRDPTARAAKQRTFGDRFTVSPVREAGTRGAALVAGVAAGIYPAVTAVPKPVSPS